MWINTAQFKILHFQKQWERFCKFQKAKCEYKPRKCKNCRTAGSRRV